MQKVSIIEKFLFDINSKLIDNKYNEIGILKYKNKYQNVERYDFKFMDQKLLKILNENELLRISNEIHEQS